MTPTLWMNLGLGGCVVVVVSMFLKHMKKVSSEHHSETEAFTKIVANHMTSEIAAREKQTAAIGRQAEAIEKLADKL